MVLWRRGAAGLEVYWVERSPRLPFMGGWHAFVGGALERGDAERPVAGRPAGLEARPPRGFPDSLREGDGEVPDDVPGLAACALRELAEETGLQVGRADRLVFAGRWLTPPLGPLRFDNRFFLLEWPAEEPAQPRVVAGELVAGEWIAPRAALDRWASGEVLAAPPILHLLRVLAEEGPERGLPRLRDPGETNLGPHRRIEFRPGVFVFPLATRTLPPATHTNCYLVGNEERVLIDPGAADAAEIDRLEAALAALAARDGGRVAAIWLTHHHPDHVGGAAELRRRLGVPLHAHRATGERLAARGLALDGELLPDAEVALGALRLRVLHTPGHARGHLCFHAAAERWLVAGDLVAGFGTIVVDPPEGDMDDYLASLERVRDLGPLTLFPAHGPALRDGQAALAELIAHRHEREASILAAWRGGRREPATIVPLVYDDVPRSAWPLAERQVQAHLDRLRRAGEI